MGKLKSLISTIVSVVTRVFCIEFSLSAVSTPATSISEPPAFPETRENTGFMESD